MTEYGELRNQQPEKKPEKKGKINCLKCRNFKVTWNPASPRACKIFGFKGKELPSATVLKVTGKECPAFSPKDK